MAESDRNFFIKMFYLNTIQQLLRFVEQLVQLEVCLPYSRLLTGIQILAVFQNLRWNSNKTSLFEICNNLRSQEAFFEKSPFLDPHLCQLN